MSLINQVLLDLDQRHALVGNLPSATRTVHRPAPPRKALRRTGTWLAAGTGVTLATLAVLAWQPIRRALETPPMVQVQAVQPIQPMQPMQPMQPAQTAQTAQPDGQLAAPTNAPLVIARGSGEIASSPRDAVGSLGLDPSGSAARDGSQASVAPIVPLPTLSMADAAPAPIPAPAAEEAPVSRLRLAEAARPRFAPRRMAASDDEQAASVTPTARPLPRASDPALAVPPALAAMPAMPRTARAGRATAAMPTLPAIEARVEKSSRPLSARERAEAEYQRALGLHQQGQPRDAQAAFAAALKEDPTHASARHALAVALIGDGRLDDAQTVLAEGLKLNPQDSALATVLARVKAEQQDLPGAIAVLKAALPGGSSITGRAESPDARALLATLQQRTGNNLAAIENYGLALRGAPNNGAWWIGLAISYTAEAKPEAAREAFERARATKSLSPELDQYVDQRLRALAR